MIVEESTDASDRPAFDEIRTFLAVMATTVRETVVRLEATTARVTELAVMRAGRADRDLVVVLQNFDRLQQEFVTLADVLVLAAGKSDESWVRTVGNGHPAEDAIAGVPIADLKDRLRRHLDAALPDLTSDTAEDAIF